MSKYPEAGFLKEFVRRTQYNLSIIENLSAENNDGYEVTQLLNSMFGMLILPKEKYWEKLSGIKNSQVKVFAKISKDKEIPNMNYQEFIKKMRNCVAHPAKMQFVQDEKSEISAMKFIDRYNGSDFNITLTMSELKKICHELCTVLTEKIAELEGM